MMTESLDNIVIDNINIEIKSILHINSTLEPIIFLHEGLGSISLWKDFPDKIAKITKRDVIIYSRLGMGNSSSLKEPRNVDYMHQEAMNYLPKILKYLKITNPILFGHSDGASIALIYAGNKNNVKSLILEAPTDSIISSQIFFVSSSLSCFGKKVSIILISDSSTANNSGLSPFLYKSAASCLCFFIFCKTFIIS